MKIDRTGYNSAWIKAHPHPDTSCATPDDSVDPLLLRIMKDVACEFVHATSMNAPMHSLHEASAVILEEYEEFWDEVKKNPRKHPRRNADARTELVQLAAMAVRAIHDVIKR